MDKSAARVACWVPVGMKLYDSGLRPSSAVVVSWNRATKGSPFGSAVRRQLAFAVAIGRFASTLAWRAAGAIATGSAGRQGDSARSAETVSPGLRQWQGLLPCAQPVAETPSRVKSWQRSTESLGGPVSDLGFPVICDNWFWALSRIVEFSAADKPVISGLRTTARSSCARSHSVRVGPSCAAPAASSAPRSATRPSTAMLSENSPAARFHWNRAKDTFTTDP